jgi:hypothetical protein
VEALGATGWAAVTLMLQDAVDGTSPLKQARHRLSGPAVPEAVGEEGDGLPGPGSSVRETGEEGWA